MANFLRFFGILRIIVRYRLDDMILSTPMLRAFKPLLYLTPWHYFPVRKFSRGERLRMSLEALGPIFIKFGQTLSTRQDLLPEDIAGSLEKLQDACQPFDGKIARRKIETALGRPLGEVFSHFDETPLASASIAQVHAATTKTGDAVVVKVLRPDIENHIRRDLRLLYALAKIAENHPDGRRLRPIEAVSEFERIIIDELDMLAEAAAADLLRRNFAASELLYVPEVYWDLCRPEVLVLERIHGTPISDIDGLRAQNIDLKTLAENGVKIFFRQVFEHNFFHADMHPGNIFVGADGRYIGVDFGIMGTLSPRDQYYLAENFLAFFHQDYRRIAEAHLASGWVPDDIDIAAFERSIRRVCAPIFQKPLKDISFGRVLLDLFKEARRFNISIQPQLLLLDKTLLNIEGLGRRLYPDLDLWTTAKPLLESIIKTKNSPKNALRTLRRELPLIARNLPNVARTLGKIGAPDLEKKAAERQKDAIVAQLKKNSENTRRAIFAAIFAILGGIFLSQNFWLGGGILLFLAAVLWARSKS